MMLLLQLSLHLILHRTRLFFSFGSDRGLLLCAWKSETSVQTQVGRRTFELTCALDVCVCGNVVFLFSS